MTNSGDGLQGKTIAQLAGDLADGKTTAEGLVAVCLDRIADPSGQGPRAFIEVNRDKALDQARASDRMRRHSVTPSPLAGVPIAIKDLFDVQGETTRAASKVLADRPPAKADAPAIARLRGAGAVFIGRNTMTEFAYSGVGINPHYGTPSSPWDRETGRVPGGSTSGGAVSVAEGMAAMAVGSDTGGSCRIPAALCGIVGFKPTASRISRQGAYPLSQSFDSIGPLANSVACVALADAVMAGEAYRAPTIGVLSHLCLAAPQRLVLDGMDETVAKTFEAALKLLRDGGAQIEQVALEEFGELPALGDKGGIVAVEALAVHRAQIEAHGAAYDPRVRDRILMATGLSGADYVQLTNKRADLIARFTRTVAPYDAVIMPAVPIVAPPFSAFETDEEYVRLNRLLLRNPSCFNALDGCAISLPCHKPGDAPVGLMLGAPNGRDTQLLDVAATVEAALAPLRAR
jgi:aspartyl-tRNA(Asn)/glutamyl-tRNA(Gln) amidotransferase subunit A